MPEPEPDTGQSLLLMVEPDAQSGSRNMAIDEFLLESAIGSGLAAVRIYRWETATVSLGYFQDVDAFRTSGNLSSLPAVRRLSGGGAILHDREITYSCVLPAGSPLLREPSVVYRIVHEAILDILSEIGVTAGMRGSDHKLADEPFLCFVRGDRNDILCDGHKVVGSAQRRRRGAVLQHGSVLLETSPHAPDIPGILDLNPGVSLPIDLAERLGISISDRLSIEGLGAVSRVDHWPGDAASDIARLTHERYERLDWHTPQS